MSKKYKHIPTGDIYKCLNYTENFGGVNYYFSNDSPSNKSACIPEHMILSGKDWEEVKEWEIISYRSKINNNWYWFKEKNGEYRSIYNGLINPHILSDDVEIYSVKRLSDGLELKIGDKLNFKIGDKEVKEFSINGHILNVHTNSFRCSIMNIDFNKLEKLFTTEDGIDIYENDIFYVVMLSDYNIRSSKEINFLITPDLKKRTFSTKEKAEEYAIMNKRSFSIKDILCIIPESQGLLSYLKSICKERMV